ncbi:hypothetical protein M5D96_000480 [Drosophila gunungcola]|uniref:Uncharacterized protein n=1 Tax=Drosophila gunungcola TaxID=103775 RepID=A0A9P9YWF8_9MUSC|nr:hypothetical protein M5D96_000480 [Drosophila gunungcola]
MAKRNSPNYKHFFAIACPSSKLAKSKRLCGGKSGGHTLQFDASLVYHRSKIKARGRRVSGTAGHIGNPIDDQSGSFLFNNRQLFGAHDAALRATSDAKTAKRQWVFSRNITTDLSAPSGVT